MADDELRKDLLFAIAQLRHAYQVLVNDQLGNVKAFANGLIAPQIRRLEELATSMEQDAAEK